MIGSAGEMMMKDSSLILSVFYDAMKLEECLAFLLLTVPHLGLTNVFVIWHMLS